MPPPTPTAGSPRFRAALPRRLLPILTVTCLLAGPPALSQGIADQQAADQQAADPASPPGAHASSLTDLGDELGLTAAEVARLEAGEAVVRSPDAEAPAGASTGASVGVAYRVLPAPAERLARAVGDWSHYEEFFPFVLSAEVVPAPGDEVRVEQRVDMPFPFPDRHFTLRADRRAPREAAPPAPGYEVSWSHLPGSGNIDAQEGRWRLWPLTPDPQSGDRTLVELHLASDAGAGVPDGLERRALLETLAWALDGLRQQVNRCRYDLPIHPTCREEPPEPVWQTAREPTEERSR